MTSSDPGINLSRFLEMPASIGNPNLKSAFTEARRKHWDAVAQQQPNRLTGIFSSYYQRLLEERYAFLVPPGQRILEIGCGKGQLLAALKPSYGVGVDFSPEMVAAARARFAGAENLIFIETDAMELANIEGPFDTIIFADSLNDFWDVQNAFRQVHHLCDKNTRIIVNYFSHLWEQPLLIGQAVGISTSTMPQNWLSRDDTVNLFRLSDFQVVRTSTEIMLPCNIPLLSQLMNRYVARLPGIRNLCFSHFLVARALPRPLPPSPEIKQPSVSVIVPTRNEAGHISEIIARIPEMGAGTEIIFVEGHSSDDTYATIEHEIAQHPERNCKLFQQSGVGKGDAVRLGYREASGDILMILDADITVAPESLPFFYDALVSGKGEFINGVRLVYPMQDEAMRFFNIIGNKFFSLAFSWLLDQKIKDTLCGTKVLRKDHYLTLAENRSYFGDFDPFGDFDLIFGAAKMNLKIIDLPIRYEARRYGETNIDRWRHGMLLLRMVLFAARRIKFI